MSDSDYDIISIHGSDHGLNHDSQPSNLNNTSIPDKITFPLSIVAADLVEPMATLEQQIAGIKANIVRVEKHFTPLHGDGQAIAQGTLETMVGLGQSVINVDEAFCRAINLAQETKAQLDVTKDKAARLDEQMLGLDLLAVAQDVCQLLITTKNMREEVAALKAQMVEFDLAMVVEDLDCRFHSVREKLRSLEKQTDEFDAIREKVHYIEKDMDVFASQTARIAAQDEKILLLEQKLERFSSYFDKMDALENQMDSFSGLRSRVTNLENKTVSNEKDITKLVGFSGEISAELNERFGKIGRSFASLDDVVENSKKVTSLEGRTDRLCKGQDQIESVVEQSKADIDHTHAVLDDRAIILGSKLQELSDIQAEAASSIEFRVMSAVNQAIFNLEDINTSLNPSLVLPITKTEKRCTKFEGRLLGLEEFSHNAVEKLGKLKKKMEAMTSLQDKVTKLDESIRSLRRAVDDDLRKESARVDNKLTFIQNDTKTLFKNVDCLDGAIGLHEKKLGDLDRDGLTVIPKALLQTWKDFEFVKFKRYSCFKEFQNAFVFYAEAAGIPEIAWKEELHSRLPSRLREATSWRVHNKDEGFSVFCRYAADVEQRLKDEV